MKQLPEHAGLGKPTRTGDVPSAAAHLRHPELGSHPHPARRAPSAAAGGGNSRVSPPPRCTCPRPGRGGRCPRWGGQRGLGGPSAGGAGPLRPPGGGAPAEEAAAGAAAAAGAEAPRSGGERAPAAPRLPVPGCARRRPAPTCLCLQRPAKLPGPRPISARRPRAATAARPPLAARGPSPPPAGCK